MKRVSLAALLALTAFAFARADEGAYKNLVGMARAAATDRGPDPDDVPARAGTEALKDALADVPAPRASAARPAPGGAPTVSGAARPPAPDAAPSPVPEKTDSVPGAVAVPAPGRPRLWTRLYSTLLPAWSRPPSLPGAFEPAASSAAVRGRTAPLAALMPPPDSEAVRAGERRGMAELMSVAAPTGAR